MNLANAISLIGILAMTGIFVYTFTTGNSTVGNNMFAMGKKA
jgi:hypothetical protein